MVKATTAKYAMRRDSSLTRWRNSKITKRRLNSENTFSNLNPTSYSQLSNKIWNRPATHTVQRVLVLEKIGWDYDKWNLLIFCTARFGIRSRNYHAYQNYNRLLNRLHFMLPKRLAAANPNPHQRKFYENTTDEILKFMLADDRQLESSTNCRQL